MSDIYIQVRKGGTGGFTIEIDFEEDAASTIEFLAPVDMQIDSISATTGSPTMKVNGTPYVLGSPIGEGDTIEVDAGGGDRTVTLSGSAEMHFTVEAIKQLPATGQVISYRDYDDGYYQIGEPATRFVDNGDGTITDTAFGVMYAKYSLGKNPDGSGSALSTNWNGLIDAANASTYAGHSDWRLANVLEAMNVFKYDAGTSVPRWHDVFALENGRHFTATTYAYNTSQGLHIREESGLATSTNKTTTYYGILVRSVGASKLPATGQTTSYRTGDDGDIQAGVKAADRLVDNGDGTITDTAFGTMWRKWSYGKNQSTGAGSNGTRTWNQAIDLNGDPHAGYSDWKLPNIIELASITRFEASGGAPYIYSTFFPDTESSYYWSSTTVPSRTSSAMYVYFNFGYVSLNVKTGSNYVRLVRQI